MQDKISLQKIIESVLDDRENANEMQRASYEENRENDIRMLRRAFDKLLERFGTDKELFQTKGNKMEFHETEIPIMKVIFNQLLDDRGLIAEFAKERNKDTEFSSKDVHALIESILDEAAKDGATEGDLEQVAEFFSYIFSCSPLRSRECCHMLVDTLFINIQSLPGIAQIRYLIKLEHILKKEVSLRIAESAIEIMKIAENIKISQEDAGDSIAPPVYSEQDPEIRNEYIYRDQRVLEKIQEDDDLRQYIEKRIGKKAEEIFNYTYLSGKA